MGADSKGARKPPGPSAPKAAAPAPVYWSARGARRGQPRLKLLGSLRGSGTLLWSGGTIPASYELDVFGSGEALLATGRPIVYSFCQYGWDAVWEWGPSLGANLWRTTGDINPTWDRMTLIGFSQAGLSKYAGPGHWNDPDMLEVGNGKLTLDENRLHMSLWAMLAAPLLAGNDLSKMPPETAAILTNHEVIAIDQDELGKQGDRVSAVGPVEIWAKPLKGGDKAVALFNRDDTPLPVTVKFSDLGLKTAKARDIWQAKDLGKLEGSYTATVPRHGVVLLRLTK